MGSLRIDDHVGRVLSGRYRLVSPLGTGASAHVFAADDVTLRRRVAVKVLHAGLADEPAFLRRFRAEAQAVAALRHPNIVAVYDWGEDGETPYLVCELLEGGSLRAVLDRGYLLSAEQAVLVGLQAARALDYAHRRGLVHRDVKPANLLFDDEERLCVADFGVARALAEAALTEPTGAMVGTARYASPEQVRGSNLDGRSDVYSLALVLIEAITGEVPFLADTTVGTLMARVNAEVPVPDALGELATILRDASALDPTDRLDAGDLAMALEELGRRLPAAEPLPLSGTAKAARQPFPIDLRDRTSLPSPAGGAPLFDQESAPYLATPTTLAKRRRRRWPVILVVLALLLGGAGGAAFVVRNRTRSVAVPTVVHLSQAAAAARLQRLHLKLRVAGQQYQDTSTPGEVLTQQPATGKLKEGKTVAVVVALGPQPVDIPDLANTTLDAATAKLQAIGLKAGKVTPANSDTIAKGGLIDWSPKGVQLPRGSTVDLTVSAGPVIVGVPDVHAAKSFDEAKAALIASGLTAVEANDTFSDAVPKGQVISVDPPVGTQVPKGTQVTVHTSKGPDVVPVPTLSGLSPAAAQAALQAAGLAPGFTFGPVNGSVFHTNPGAGTVVHRGTTVNLYTQ